MLPPARFHSNITLSNFPNNDRSEATLNRISLSRMQLRDLRGTKSHCTAIYVNSRRETPRDAQCYTNKGKSKDYKTGVAFSKQDLGKRGMQEALQICENEQRVHGKHIQAIPLRPTAPVIKWPCERSSSAEMDEADARLQGIAKAPQLSLQSRAPT